MSAAFRWFFIVVFGVGGLDCFRGCCVVGGWLLLDLVSGGFVLVVSCSCWVYVGVVVGTLDYRVDVCWGWLFWGGFRVDLVWCLVLGLAVLSW